MHKLTPVDTYTEHVCIIICKQLSAELFVIIQPGQWESPSAPRSKVDCDQLLQLRLREFRAKRVKTKEA